MTFNDLIEIKEKADALHLTTREREIAVAIAELQKAQRLARTPGMDSVAVALNKEPSHHDVVAVVEVLRYAKAFGFELAREPA
jgi:hypothetical protein